jgi:hypothetical protein
MLFEKSYDIFLGFLVETILKYFENFPHFLFKIFQTNFFEITGLKYATFNFFQICPCFVSSLLFIL